VSCSGYGYVKFWTSSGSWLMYKIYVCWLLDAI